jgi:type I restriction enzyme R subunit
VSGFNEASTIQAAIIARAAKSDLGWTYIPGDQLGRSLTDVIFEEDLVDALARLNPVIAEKPEWIEEILPKLRALILSTPTEGLVETNERLTRWLRGLETHKFVGTDDYVNIRLIDFDDPRANKLVISDEVIFQGADKRRFDVVAYVNGIPLVVGETKTPVDMEASWLDAATDITDIYWPKTGSFFAGNVFCFGTDGRAYHYGAVGQPAEKWLPWGHTADPLLLGPLEATLRSVELMLAPEMLLAILRDYTLYSSVVVGPETTRIKIIPRYPQVEGVDAIIKRAKDPLRKGGLLWQHQGSGKTYLMGFAAGKLLRDAELDGPTVLVVLDRLDLIDQVVDEFTSAGIPRLRVAETKEELRTLLKEDSRGVIITTIFRFPDAGELNIRSNIIVLVDEAHRTQEGRLGWEMREALPNATFFGLTGTPVTDADRNTFTLFGDPDDPGYVLSHYSMERSIADGATLPVHVETRLVDYQLDKEALDTAFEELVDEEGLSDEDKETLIRRAGSVQAFVKDPERIEAVCEDIVEHWWSKMRPVGLKAQVVVYDREMCVAYEETLNRMIAERVEAEGEEVTPQVEVVMTVGSGKNDPDSWSVYKRTRDQESAIKARFKDVHDPLSFLVVTAKLLTGFDAPIEGVMYLDKPLRAHALFQAITRTNRRWTNPTTSQEKLHGLVVDYVGLGPEIAKAIKESSPEGGKQPIINVEDLYTELESAVAECLKLFYGVDRAEGGFESLMAAQDLLKEQSTKDSFAKQFLTAHGLWEFLYYDPALKPLEEDYRWLAKVYASIQPPASSQLLLWHRLGQKTLDLVHSAITEVTVISGKLDEVVVDEEIIEAIKQMKLNVTPEGEDGQVTARQVLDTLEKRLEKKLSGSSPHPVWRKLSDRLEDLRRAVLIRAEDSVDFLKRLLEIAREVLEADRAEAAGTLDEYESALPDPHIGALTQIFAEYAPDTTPDIVARIVERIDAIAGQVRGTGWQESQPADKEVRREIRKVLRDYSLPLSGDLYNRAYEYVRENY